MKLAIALTLLSILKIFTCQESCVIDVDCDDCLPEYLPAILTHEAVNKFIRIPHGHEMAFSCHNSKFKRYGSLNNLNAACENGYFRITHNAEVVHLNELGCQANYIEDTSHAIDNCNATYQGRSYQYQNAISSQIHHLAELCYDAEYGRTVFVRMTFANNNDIEKEPHQDNPNKISMMDRLQHMFDTSYKIESEKVHADDRIMNKHMKLLLGSRTFNFADHSLVSARMIPASYFHNQNGKIARFPHNKVPVWKSVAEGNLKHIQRDITNKFIQNTTDVVDLYSGTFQTLSLYVEQRPTEIFLQPDRKFPVPKYIYTIIHNKSKNQGLAIVLINNPFISIGEIRNAVFCQNICPMIPWLKDVRMNDNYGRSTYGLVFCCDVFSFSNYVVEGPNILKNLNAGERGILKD